MSDLLEEIPLNDGNKAFNCPHCNGAMRLLRATDTPEGYGVGEWECGRCHIVWSENGDEWFAKRPSNHE